MNVFEFSSKTNFTLKEVNPQSKFKIGDIVKHHTGKWLAKVKAKKFDYAYGLCGVSKEKLWLYTLQDDKIGFEIMGLWGEPELTEA
jgi:hypothetical protein